MIPAPAFYDSMMRVLGQAPTENRRRIFALMCEAAADHLEVADCLRLARIGAAAGLTDANVDAAVINAFPQYAINPRKPGKLYLPPVFGPRGRGVASAAELQRLADRGYAPARCKEKTAVAA